MKKTRDQITAEEFAAYTSIQASGAFNMLDSRAIAASGLDPEIYIAIITNYSYLSEKFRQEKKA